MKMPLEIKAERKWQRADIGKLACAEESKASRRAQYL
jgi:hypothetical protein